MKRKHKPILFSYSTVPPSARLVLKLDSHARLTGLCSDLQNHFDWSYFGHEGVQAYMCTIVPRI